jgi:uncharacterized repeat protein (TIGR01451 family)
MDSSSIIDSDTIVWPESLPLPAQMVDVDVQTKSVRTVMETGRVRKRRTTTVPLKIWAVTWNFTFDEYAGFRNFFNGDLVNGSESFVIELMGVDTIVAFADGSYSFFRSDNLFSVKAELEENPISIIKFVDLVLTVAAPNVLLLNGEFAYVFTVRNEGNQTATGIVLQVDLDLNLDFLSDTSDIEPDSAGTILFNLGSIASGALKSVTVNFASNITIPVHTTGVVTSPMVEIGTVNNTVVIDQQGGFRSSYDDFESYSNGNDLNGLDGNLGWSTPFVSHSWGEPAYDDIESYTATTELNGLSGGSGWADGFISHY